MAQLATNVLIVFRLQHQQSDISCGLGSSKADRVLPQGWVSKLDLQLITFMKRKKFTIGTFSGETPILLAGRHPSSPGSARPTAAGLILKALLRQRHLRRDTSDFSIQHCEHPGSSLTQVPLILNLQHQNSRQPVRSVPAALVGSIFWHRGLSSAAESLHYAEA